MMNFNNFFLFSEEYNWLLNIIIAIVVLLLINFIFIRILKRIKKKSQGSEDWKSKIIFVFYNPITLLIWTSGLAFIANVVFYHYKLDPAIVYVKLFRNIIIVFSITWLLFRWKKDFEQIILEKWKNSIDRASVVFINKILSIGIFFIALLIILEILGLNVMPLVAFGGIGAAAIGLAGRDVISNFFGGLMLYINRPMVPGDAIELPKQDIVGTVKHIGWYNSCIIDYNKVPIYIPNSLFSTEIIRNRQRMTHRRFDETFGFRYEDFSKLHEIINQIRDYIKSDEDVDKSSTPFVFFNTIGIYTLDVIVKAYISKTSFSDFMETKQRMIFKIKEIILSNGADLAYPTTTVEMSKDTK